MEIKEKLKVSVLTATYNREQLLNTLYNSLIKNSKYNVDIEWLIMDDGSTDNTKKVVEEFIKANEITVKYYSQKNQGKMVAINNLVNHATGKLIIECDSDDYFTENAFEIIENEYDEYKNKKNIYGLCFLKYDQNGKNMGNEFKNKKTTMFDLYFKEGEKGEKAIVFISDFRKKFKHELEKNEKFITEARMYHKMDEEAQVLCFNKPIMICEYQKNGYTKNIEKEFKENPYGYYYYFLEILQRDIRGIKFSKRLYVIKHLILFTTLTNEKKNINKIKGIRNKVLYVLLYIPGKIKTKNTFLK